jgi:cytochrome c2
METIFQETGRNLNTIAQKKQNPFFKGMPVQRKLTIGAVNDPCEIEADRVADQVVGMSESQVQPQTASQTGALVQRKCAACEEEQIQKKSIGDSVTPIVQRKTAGAESGTASNAITNQINNSKGGGTSMDKSTSSYMESRFGTDFSGIRIHTDNNAIQMSRELNAQAFTVGNDIYFNEGKYNPGDNSGKHLLAHELTHTLQQEGVQRKVQRQQMDGEIDLMDDPRMHSEGAPDASSCGAPSHCPPGFCQPYSSESYARYQKAKMTPLLLTGIAMAVDSKVLPLWVDYLNGGSTTKNLTSDFGADFAASPKTVSTSYYLSTALQRVLARNPLLLPTASQTIDMSSFISTEIGNINTPSHRYEMNFDTPSDIAGNIAGGIGRNQITCQSGAIPSPFNDQRLATVICEITVQATGVVNVQPIIEYKVKDTIDLCPGNCGSAVEQFATVPLSQFEATGIAGDVPFIVDFIHRPASFNITP